MHQTRRPINRFVNLTNRSSYDGSAASISVLDDNAVCIHQAANVDYCFYLLLHSGHCRVLYQDACDHSHLLSDFSQVWWTPVIASGKAAPACRPQNTMPIFLSWIGALRSWQANSIVIGSPNTIRRAGPLNLQHKNGTGMVGPFQDKANEIHFGTVLWTVLGTVMAAKRFQFAPASVGTMSRIGAWTSEKYLETTWEQLEARGKAARIVKMQSRRQGCYAVPVL
jgi:hypothetical protein